MQNKILPCVYGTDAHACCYIHIVRTVLLVCVRARTSFMALILSDALPPSSSRRTAWPYELDAGRCHCGAHAYPSHGSTRALYGLYTCILRGAAKTLCCCCGGGCIQVAIVLLGAGLGYLKLGRSVWLPCAYAMLKYDWSTLTHV